MAKKATQKVQNGHVSLLDSVSKIPVAEDPRRRHSWHRRLKESNPGLYGELVELVEDWSAEGVVRQKFRSKKALHTYLSGRDQERPMDPPILTCQYCAFCDFVDLVRSGKG